MRCLVQLDEGDLCTSKTRWEREVRWEKKVIDINRPNAKCLCKKPDFRLDVKVEEL